MHIDKRKRTKGRIIHKKTGHLEERSDDALCRAPAVPGILPLGKIVEGEKAAGVYEGAEPPVLRYGQRDNYRTNYDDFRDVYLLGIQVDNRLTKEALL